MTYQPVRYKLGISVQNQALDLGGLEWADITSSTDGRVFHFRDLSKNLSFTAVIGGRTLAMTLDGDEPRNYSDEEIELAMLLALKDEIAERVVQAEERPKVLKARVNIKLPEEVHGGYSHLREAVKMVHAPTVK